MLELSLEEFERFIINAVKKVVSKIEEEKEDCFITTKKAAKLLDCSPPTVSKLKGLPRYKRPNEHGRGLLRYKKSEVMDYLKRQKIGNMYVDELYF